MVKRKITSLFFNFKKTNTRNIETRIMPNSNICQKK